MNQRGDGQAVGTGLVLLDLLIGDTEDVAAGLKRDPVFLAQLAKPDAEMAIDGVGRRGAVGIHMRIHGGAPETLAGS